MEAVFCPCGTELSSGVYASRSVQLQREGNKWIEKHVFFSGCQCPICHEEIGTETLDKLEVPAEYR